MSIQTLTIPQREENIQSYCPFCGVNTFSSLGTLTPCKHLALSFSSIGDPCIAHIDESISNILKNNEELSSEEIIQQLQNHQNENKYIAFHEIESGSTPYDSLTIYFIPS